MHTTAPISQGLHLGVLRWWVGADPWVGEGLSAFGELGVKSQEFAKVQQSVITHHLFGHIST